MDIEKFKKATGLSALYYNIPRHANTIWYSLGGLTLFCFLVTIVSGILMSQFYSPWIELKRKRELPRSIN